MEIEIYFTTMGTFEGTISLNNAYKITLTFNTITIEIWHLYLFPPLKRVCNKIKVITKTANPIPANKN